MVFLPIRLLVNEYEDYEYYIDKFVGINDKEDM